ncbi:MAG: hypothetical protein COA42_00035 [Alteromonadaceae bacterium]|nr:MAG: hypothetical protein COA42_00035 [Alteromonadaceae bacterium]
MIEDLFWQTKKLPEMNSEEWEALCDGCGKCCLHKLEDEDSGDVYYTDVACKHLDLKLCRCQNYAQRSKLVSGCMRLDKMELNQYFWLPETCAYRLLSEDQPLFEWHPLVSGSQNSVHEAGISVLGRVVEENSVDIDADDMEEHVISWVE